MDNMHNFVESVQFQIRGLCQKMSFSKTQIAALEKNLGKKPVLLHWFFQRIAGDTFEKAEVSSVKVCTERDAFWENGLLDKAVEWFIR